MRLLFSILLATGCAPSGIYMITVPYSDGAIECTSELSENFEDGFSPDPEDSESSDWTFEEEYVGADQVMFFHIASTSGGSAVLTWGDAVYPGVAEGDGWTFSWTEATHGSNVAEHTDGYRYEESYSNDSTLNIHVSQAMFAEVTGTISGTGSSSYSYFESDEWDPEDTEFGRGQIPSESYLVYKEEGELYAQMNMFDVDDCKGDDCEILLDTSCDQAGSPFTAKRVEGDDTMFYNDWKDDGQSGGGVAE